MVLRRLGLGIVSVFLLLMLVFFALRLIPGDPALVLAGPAASAQDVVDLRRQLGLDAPLLIQFARFLRSMLSADFGSSIVTGAPVAPTVASRIPATLLLATLGLFVATLSGILAGIVAAARRGRILDGFVTIGTVLVTSIPTFWFAVVLVAQFSVKMGLLPASGMGTVSHAILPVLALASAQVAQIVRVTRGSVLDVMNLDYVKTAKSKGATAWRTWSQHILRNALIPVVTMVGLQFGLLLGATVITESVFSWPGIGQLLVMSVRSRDYPVIQALTLLYGVSFVIINLIVDVMNRYLSPELRRLRD